ncbi:DUF6281 family protein [Nocardioides sp. URHA0020]|uniref:DUF6281 family protein n=1 Tax=Nocardioides sp. URHA0020 TaxID=1380392 RepID=UPI000AA8719D|nr:DUF6281 family protein [Nocardioides sp. URHA0020]
MIARTRILIAVGLVAGSGALVGCGSSTEGGGGASASCAAIVEYDGARYLGTGEVHRTPVTTGRVMPAVAPGCDDTGGQDDQTVQDTKVQVEELAAVDPRVAVLLNGGIYVREGASVPAVVRSWLRAPRCSTPGVFEITADWLGLTGPHEPRTDGDVRLPYQLEVRVTDGPERYVGGTITLDATTATDPELSSDDVEQSLWEGGQLTARVRCLHHGFDVVGVRAVR